MLDGVLDERLENQPRHVGVERLRIDVELHGQPILEANLFDLEVLLQELQFLFQRDAGGAGAIEGEAEQIAEPADHAIRRFGIRVHERRDRVERVEQEVRVELRFERLEPGFHRDWSRGAPL